MSCPKTLLTLRKTATISSFLRLTSSSSAIFFSRYLALSCSFIFANLLVLPSFLPSPPAFFFGPILMIDFLNLLSREPKKSRGLCSTSNVRLNKKCRCRLIDQFVLIFGIDQTLECEIELSWSFTVDAGMLLMCQTFQNFWCKTEKGSKLSFELLNRSISAYVSSSMLNNFFSIFNSFTYS